MEKLKRISSKDENQFIDILQAEDGAYILHKYVKKYDSEEECNYEVREFPDPTGRYGELGPAIYEAEKILKLK